MPIHTNGCYRTNKRSNRYYKNEQRHLQLNPATAVGLDVLAAWLSSKPAAVLLLTTIQAIHDPLWQRIVLTPSLEIIQSKYNVDKFFSLLIVQPQDEDLAKVESSLHHPHLCQVIHLQPTWIGRRLLPEWRPTHKNIVTKTIKHRLGDWHCEDRSIGNLQSILWGFLSGRMVALNRPDLVDRCAARMRRHLFPAPRPTALAYLRLFRWVKEYPNL